LQEYKGTKRYMSVDGQLFKTQGRSDDFKALAAVCRERLGPRRSLLAVMPGDAQNSWLQQKVPAMAAMKPVNGRATAYLCENFTCQAPVTVAADLRKLLNEGAG